MKGLLAVVLLLCGCSCHMAIALNTQDMAVCGTFETPCCQSGSPCVDSLFCYKNNCITSGDAE